MTALAEVFGLEVLHLAHGNPYHQVAYHHGYQKIEQDEENESHHDRSSPLTFFARSGILLERVLPGSARI